VQKVFPTVLPLLLFLSVLGAQEDLSQAKKLAEESAQALISGNYGRVADLTYPKVVELMGGREKVVKEMEKGEREMKAERVEFVSATDFIASKLVKTKTQKFAVLSYKLKMKVPGGYLLRDSFMLGVASANSDDWKFLDGAGLDTAKMKFLFPDMADKITLPTLKPPILQKSEQN